MEHFSGLNAPNMDSGSQPNVESSSAGAGQPGSNDGSLWDPSLALGMSDEITPAFLHAQQNLGGIPYGGLGGSPRTPRPADAIQAATAARKRGGHDRKRARIGSDAAALESVDYWIHLDDDDHDNTLGGSFEIDFSGRSNDTASFARYVLKVQGRQRSEVWSACFLMATTVFPRERRLRLAEVQKTRS